MSQIKSARVFLGKSCQNELMRSNNFDVNVPVTIPTEVEAPAKNYYGCELIFNFFMVNRHEKSNFWNQQLFDSGYFLVHFLTTSFAERS